VGGDLVTHCPLGAVRWGLDAATPFLQQFFSEYPPGGNY
jgi:hypothetical protein